MRFFSMKAASATLAVLALPLFVSAAPLSSISATAQSNNEIGFRLMQASLKSEKDAKNVLVSPISAHYALSMALNGSSDQTRAEFLEALGYEATTTVPGLNKENADMLKALSVAPLTPAQLKALPAWEKRPPVVSIQNSIWSTNGKTSGEPYTFLPSFVKAMKSNYGVEQVKSLDFKDKKSADVINQWTSDATYKMIPKIIDADTMKNLLWVLLNTTYLEAQWTSPFGKPFDDDFTKLDGQKKKVKMLSRRSRSQFADLPNYQVAELEMAKSTLRAYVVLPKNAGQFESLQADAKSGIWTESTWNEILSSLKTEQGVLSMPKFTFEYGVEMKEDGPVTNAMGLNFLFKNSARFDEMDSPNSPPSKVGIIKQNTKIEWDENGVKAAAATLVGGVRRTAVIRDTYSMVVDRPFYVAIQDSATGAFLFLGQVIDPK